MENTIFETKEEYLQFKKAWASRKEHTAWEHMLYNILRGHDLTRGFTKKNRPVDPEYPALVDCFGHYWYGSDAYHYMRSLRYVGMNFTTIKGWSHPHTAFADRYLGTEELRDRFKKFLIDLVEKGEHLAPWKEKASLVEPDRVQNVATG